MNKNQIKDLIVIVVGIAIIFFGCHFLEWPGDDVNQDLTKLHVELSEGYYSFIETQDSLINIYKAQLAIKDSVVEQYKLCFNMQNMLLCEKDSLIYEMKNVIFKQEKLLRLKDVEITLGKVSF